MNIRSHPIAYNWPEHHGKQLKKKNKQQKQKAVIVENDVIVEPLIQLLVAGQIDHTKYGQKSYKLGINKTSMAKR